MKELKDFTYGIVGLGLMGGSLAKAVRENVLDVFGAAGKIYATDINQVSLDLAVQGKIIDKGYALADAKEMLAECDLVYICLYPHKTLDFLKANKEAFKSGAIITDISGVKQFIADSLDEILRDDVDFILGHPMAGGEKEGYVHSNGAFFQKRNYILMPTEKNKKENIQKIKELISAMGFTRIIVTDSKTHDHKIAFTSQLCHVIASALVDSAEDNQITAFGGGSYEDLTRIAMINAPLWTELFLSNKEELLNHITGFEKALSEMKELIKTENAQELSARLSEVRRKRMEMSMIQAKI